jgi:hypothetical protein
VLEHSSAAQGFFCAGGEERGMQAIDETTERKLELKYCEGCGALQLRAEGSQRVYCVNCWKVLREMAGAKRRARRQP